MLALVLTGCASEEAEPPADAPAETPAETPEISAPVEGPEDPATETAEDETETGGACAWDVPQIVSDTAVEPGGQEGDLADILPGAWQEIGYDSGDGYQSFSSDNAEENRDYRFFFDGDSETFLFCQDTPETDKGERRGDYVLSDGDLELLPDDGTYTPLTWNDDALTWENHFTGATIYLQRR